MQYQTVKKAVFLSRPNRFIARVELDGAVETVHVKNTGSCPARLSGWQRGAVPPARPALI